MKPGLKQLVNWGFAVAIAALFFFVGEGIYSLYQWERSHRSLAYHMAELVDGFGQQTPQPYYRPVLTDVNEVENLLDEMKANNVGLGHSPYKLLVTAEVSVRKYPDDCGPLSVLNVRKFVSSLRTPLFEPFNPISIFYDRDRPLSDPVQRFVDDYAVHLTNYSTDELGNRMTVPVVDAPDIVFIAGDSIANGVGVHDRETLDSTLQQREPQRRYINLGIGGAEAAEIRCALERAAEHYSKQVRELIYIYCENDFDEEERMGTPEAVIDWLAEFVRDEDIERTTVVYAPYIFNTMPELTRFPGSREHFDDNADSKARLITLVKDAGFHWVDFGDLVLAEVVARGTPFAGLSLYLDVVHHSPLGIQRLADAIEASRQHSDDS